MSVLPGSLPVDARLPWVRSFSALDAARAELSPGRRERAFERAGRSLGDSLRAQPKVVSVRTLPTSLAPYPIRFAFNGTVPELYSGALLIMHNRSLLVQVQSEDGLKNVLFNPTDGPANQATPFYQRLVERTPKLIASALKPKPNRCAAQLAELGLSCADIDVIAFDHFHTQDLRPLLGADGLAARFPNAYLLAPRIEWEDWDDLPMLQRAWFIPEGKRGVPAERVVLFDGDVSLGDGLMLVRTPGHTRGNQTLFVHTERGVFGCSENGTSVDNWTPRASRMNRVRRAAELLDLDVVLNSNTPELAAEQYSSMLLERAIVDRVPDQPEFVQMFPSSEVAWHPIAPHVSPSHVFGAITSGEVRTLRSSVAASAQPAPASARA
jgi:glyoxylase-like metal-dependent hydrolase (beta-lactamase superfamily II)